MSRKAKTMHPNNTFLIEIVNFRDGITGELISDAEHDPTIEGFLYNIKTREPISDIAQPVIFNEVIPGFYRGIVEAFGPQSSNKVELKVVVTMPSESLSAEFKFPVELKDRRNV